MRTFGSPWVHLRFGFAERVCLAVVSVRCNMDLYVNHDKEWLSRYNHQNSIKNNHLINQSHLAQLPLKPPSGWHTSSLRWATWGSIWIPRVAWVSHAPAGQDLRHPDRGGARSGTTRQPLARRSGRTLGRTWPRHRGLAHGRSIRDLKARDPRTPGAALWQLGKRPSRAPARDQRHQPIAHAGVSVPDARSDRRLALPHLRHGRSVPWVSGPPRSRWHTDAGPPAGP